MMLETHIWKVPVIIYRKYGERSLEDLQIKASADLGDCLSTGTVTGSASRMTMKIRPLQNSRI